MRQSNKQGQKVAEDSIPEPSSDEADCKINQLGNFFLATG